MQYRKEIDGLRAIAVLPVIFFHAGQFGFSGGYVGVDVFFVISGFLITSIIIEEIEQKRFSIINFYERRARRILPALSVVLLVTTLASYLLMPADLLKSYCQSLVSVATFSSNVFFYLTSGYFATASDEKPLLHTWSLAVEEQYYIFFPVLLSLLWWLGRKKLVLFFLTLSILSLSLSQYLSIKQLNDANFYLIFSRAWELFAGSLIAFSGTNKLTLHRSVREMLGFAGLALVIYATLIFDDHTPFPSFYTLIPVIGTMAILSFADHKTLTGKLLANKIFVGIGLISYSLYLWHQPLFAFIRMKTIGKPDESLFLIAIALTLILSILSYKYVEKPFRNKKAVTRKKIFQLSLSTLSLFLLIGVSGHVFKGYENRFEKSRYLETVQYSPKRETCHTKGEDYMKPAEACRYFGKQVTWAVFGDSHMVEPAYALAKILQTYDLGLVHLTFSGCPPALLFDVKLPGCTQWVNEALTYLENEQAIHHVFLGFRDSAFLFGDNISTYPGFPNRNPIVEFSETTRNSLIKDAREEYWQSYKLIIERLIASGKKVYLLYPIPELPLHITKAIHPFSMFGSKPMLDLEHSTSVEYFNTRHKYILTKLDTLSYGENLYAIKPFETLCDTDYCSAVSDGMALYFDDDHLSLTGADKVLTQSVIEDELKLVNLGKVEGSPHYRRN